MTQLHKRFTDGQVKVLLNGYCQGLLVRAEIQEMLCIGKTHSFALLKEENPIKRAGIVSVARKLRAAPIIFKQNQWHRGARNSATSLQHQRQRSRPSQERPRSGEPLFPGWYADRHKAARSARRFG